MSIQDDLFDLKDSHPKLCERFIELEKLEGWIPQRLAFDGIRKVDTLLGSVDVGIKLEPKMYKIRCLVNELRDELLKVIAK